MSKKRMIVAIVAVIALVAILGVCLVACNAKSYQKKLEKAGYKVTVVEGDDLKAYAEEFGGELKWAVSAVKIDGENYESVSVVKFKKSSDAKKAYNDAKDAFEFLGDGYDVYRTGSIVISGTKQGVKDAK